ncbi:MAG: hypothetical protein GY727_10670, partial [Gammaproteobacteria bacterium]|nr:hypothetical protein [Gammaproteobacteria bacterium]
DTAFYDYTLSTTLAANTPDVGRGLWTVESGVGGIFSNDTLPGTTFTGQPCTDYTLAWSISNICDTTTDHMDVSFFATPTQAIAGDDQAFYDYTLSTTLAANTPYMGTGLWTVESGEGGSFNNDTLPNAVLTGQPCTDYTLAWSISNICDATTDHMDVSFFATPSVADAGKDSLLNGNNPSLNLYANTPLFGTGQWTILSGNSGIIVEPSNPVSKFIGLQGITYDLQWAIFTTCDTAFDIVEIGFSPWNCGSDIIIDPRDQQIYHTLAVAEQCWMAKNLNIGIMIQSTNLPSDNNIIEKYCYNNDPSYCLNHVGGMYLWDEMMQYDTLPGIQGICPPGWHLPTDDDWCYFEFQVDPTIICQDIHWRGTYGGTAIKVGGSSGFNATLGGWRSSSGAFHKYGHTGMIWTSTDIDTLYYDAAINRLLHDDSHKIYRGVTEPWNSTGAVRCLRDLSQY